MFVQVTNVYTSQLSGIAKSLLGRTYFSAYSVQLASEPLTEGQLRTVLPQHHSCGDTEHLRLRYFRLDRDGRFVIGAQAGSPLRVRHLRSVFDCSNAPRGACSRNCKTRHSSTAGPHVTR